MEGAGETLLEARLPHGPGDPQALQRLCEAMALWCGQTVHAVLAVDGPGAFCASRAWLDTFEQLTRRALYEVEFVAALGPGADEWYFADVHRLLAARLVR